MHSIQLSKSGENFRYNLGARASHPQALMGAIRGDFFVRAGRTDQRHKSHIGQ